MGHIIPRVLRLRDASAYLGMDRDEKISYRQARNWG